MESTSFSLKTLLEKTLSKAINDYLKGIEDRTEKSLLKRFKEFMKEKHPSSRVKDVKPEHFDIFLKSLSLSEKSWKSCMYRLNRFKAHIGLSQKKVKQNPKPMDKEYRQLVKKKEKELAEKDQALTLHRKTIEKKDRIIDTLRSKGMDIKAVENLQTTKAQLEKEIEKKKAEYAEREKMIENQRIFEVECPHGKGLVSLGNECHSCIDYVNCPLSSRRPDLLNVKEEKEETEEEYD